MAIAEGLSHIAYRLEDLQSRFTELLGGSSPPLAQFSSVQELSFCLPHNNNIQLERTRRKCDPMAVSSLRWMTRNGRRIQSMNILLLMRRKQRWPGSSRNTPPDKKEPLSAKG